MSSKLVQDTSIDNGLKQSTIVWQMDHVIGKKNTTKYSNINLVVVTHDNNLTKKTCFLE
jgi:hypothetical protein